MLTKYLPLLALSLLSLNSSAQEKEERIYQIELIVFERANQQDSNDLERWPKNLDLNYPDNSEKLINPLEASQDKALKPRPRGGPSIQLSEGFLHSIAPIERTKGATETRSNKPTTPLNSNLAEHSTPPEPEGGEEAVEQQANFLQQLEDSHKALTAQHKALDRTRGLRTVFHETWIQSLEDESTAPSILIRGGNKFGSHYELEGSVKLSVSRYLHIDTDLWLTSFMPDYGQQSEHWPELPSQDKTYLWATQSPPGNSSEYSPTAIQLNFSSLNANRINTHYSNEGALGGIDHPQASPYIIKEIVTLRQKRKMRSNELHYIDHPRMGLLVKITPYERPTDESPKDDIQ